MKTCNHTSGAVFGCAECVRDVRALYPEFPLQTSKPPTKPGPLTIPWSIAEQSWNAYAARYGKDQSVERMAERGGFSWWEMDNQLPGWREMVDPYRTIIAENAKLKAELDLPITVKGSTPAADLSDRGERVSVECPDCDAWVVLAPNEMLDRGVEVGKQAAANHFGTQPLGVVRALYGVCPQCDAQIGLVVTRLKSALAAEA